MGQAAPYPFHRQTNTNVLLNTVEINVQNSDFKSIGRFALIDNFRHNAHAFVTNVNFSTFIGAIATLNGQIWVEFGLQKALQFGGLKRGHVLAHGHSPLGFVYHALLTPSGGVTPEGSFTQME